MSINTQTKICLIIGDPVKHSLSPQIHNEAYKKLKIDDQYVFVAANVKISELSNAIAGFRAMNFRGLTCTMPHKLAVIPYLDRLDKSAMKIGAVNTIVNEKGILIGYNTDWIGIVEPLKKILTKKRMQLKDKTVAVIGAGGAARAIVYGLTKNKARVIIYNRTLSQAKKLAITFNCQAKSLDRINEVLFADIIINATPIGMAKLDNQTLVPKKYLTPNHIVFDIVYHPLKTRLIKDAEEKGAKIIYGTEMLLYQATTQFTLYTGYAAPIEIMRKKILDAVKY